MKITINKKEIEVEDNLTILDVARANNIHIPVLCHLNLHSADMVNDGARCRVCMVEVEGRHNLVSACNTKLTDGMVIKTNSARAIKARRTNMELALSDHPKDCLVCPRNNSCELQRLASDMSIDKIKFSGASAKRPTDNESVSIVRDLEKCVLCGRCETMCNEVQTVGVYSKIKRGFDTVMTTAYNDPLTKTPCTFCGQCVSVCPTAALTEVNDTSSVWNALNDPEKIVIVQTAPAIRAALGEMFDMEVGTNVTGKMVSALRELGFNKVYDTNFAADLTVMEETKELITRIKNNIPLPILTSCCLAWVNFIEYHYPDLLDIPSTCKSPQEMFGAVAKEYLPSKLNVEAKDIVVVAVMPCLAKKFEANRDELSNNGMANVDYVISTRELGKMIKEAGIDFASLEDESFDNLMGESTGAGVIFGTSGGVIEAVVRTAAFIQNNQTLGRIDFEELRGSEGIREATITIGSKELNIAIAHGLGNARTLLDNIKEGKSNYHAIEIMACPSGCVGGGGQPYYLNMTEDTLNKRAACLRSDDKANSKRVSAENEEIAALYSELLGDIGGEKAHELLHTEYFKNKKS